MNFLVPITLFGWPLVVLMFFALLSPRKAVLAGYIGAWLFIPMAGYEIQGLPDYTKVSATTSGVLLGMLLFDSQQFSRLRTHWIDLPMTIFCLWPMASSIAGDHGVYDGMSAIVEQIITWGLPYLFGRIYFTSLTAIRELAVAIIIGGLIYVPLCLIEIRLSPQLHTWVYGYHQHSFAQTKRFGGFRPTVFMQHGLMVAMWMTNATLLAIWLWSTGSVRKLWGAPMGWFVVVLLVTTILVKSLGALALMALGLGVIFFARWQKRAWPLLLLIAVPPLWMLGRTFGLVDGQLVYDLFYAVSPDRAQSFQVRLDQEDEITKMAMQQPITGGSRWWANGADQLWLLVFRNFGAIGLAAFTAVLILPSAILFYRVRSRILLQPAYAPLAGLSMIVLLYMIDNLVNAMINPVFILAAGAMASVVTALQRISTGKNRPQAQGVINMTRKHTSVHIK